MRRVEAADAAYGLRDAADFRPIGDYGLLADCNGAALVDRGGSIDWLCLPRYDSPAIFAGLLDPGAGHWSLRPSRSFEVERRYLDGTLVLETLFQTESGAVRLRDALAFGAGQRGHEIGLRVPHEVLRTVEGVSGQVEVEMELAARPEYGLIAPLWRPTEQGARTLGPGRLAVAAGVPVEVHGQELRARFGIEEGHRVGFAMRAHAPEATEPEVTAASQVAARLDDVVEAWRSWEAEHDIYEGEHRDQVRLSSRVLKGLTYRPTGAIVAAPTTSLPEAIGGERNWDYRYAWIRDASFTIEALYIGACSDEAENFVSFLTGAAGGHVHGKPLQIMYGVGGEHDLSERRLPHLRGWRDSRPVRVGNAAWSQTQLDVYGEFLSALHVYRERIGELAPETRHFVADLAEAAIDGWERPDAGIWEMRGEPQHHLSSKVLCWVALDRAVKLAPALGAHADAERWGRERDRIREVVLDRGWSEARQAYAQSLDSDELDAAALLMPLFGFLPASEERMRSTIEAIARELTEDGLVLRYRAAEGMNPDGMAGREGAFAICSFWLVRCLAQAGELDRAEALFERLTASANDLGLLAEEIDGSRGELLGNFPQAFSHVGLIRAAWEIDRRRAGTGVPRSRQ